MRLGAKIGTFYQNSVSLKYHPLTHSQIAHNRTLLKYKPTKVLLINIPHGSDKPS